MNKRYSALLFLLTLLLHQRQTKELEVYVEEQCHWNNLRLNCSHGFTINVIQIELGETTCRRAQCCPKSNDCTATPSTSHANTVYRVCNGLQTCQISVAQEKTECQWPGGTNEFERIRYHCLENGTTQLPSNETSADSTEYDNSTEETTFAPLSDKQTGDATTSTVLAVVIALVVILIVGSLIVVRLIRRRKLLAKAPLNNGDTSVSFRQLESTRDSVPAVSPPSDEPLYELETSIPGGRNSEAPLVTENEYSEPDGPCPSPNGLYSEPSEWNRKLYGNMKAPASSVVEPSCGDMMTHNDQSHEYDEVDFNAKSKDSGPNAARQHHVYGNVTDPDDTKHSLAAAAARSTPAAIYNEPTPWSESAYDAAGMRPVHPESEYMMPTVHPMTSSSSSPEVTSPSSGGAPSGSVYCSMDRLNTSSDLSSP